MTQQHILLFFISVLFTFTINSQELQDSLKVKEVYGIRVGIDISKPINSFFNNETKGLEIVGDFRITRNHYAAVELGFLDKTTNEDYINFTTKGSYIKAGFNYNAYKNWKGMNNEIYVGLRYGFSIFNQTLNSYTPNVNGTYFISETLQPATEFKDLTAQWLEFVFGMKVETFNNLYLGASVSLNKMINTKEPENFKNLHIPGFNRVFLNNTGVGFNYTLSYLIPILKKNK
ncbi:MAG: hypothetical protein GQ540_12065 [Lutibacter sp.]|uniref:DUF6048 family protein n=1 Tax=Lutibacter sp. TaxID=1925666 RepID=UPI001A0BCFBE|nr:DUF6048 family protein [Lutibacter sp.]NOR29253.1 hypothetical protein [Lutibacter sp.]